MPVVVTVTTPSSNPPKRDEGAPLPAHHKEGGYINPWDSWFEHKNSLKTALHVYQEWHSKPVPPPELLPQVITPTWGHASSPTAESEDEWSKDIKATWLGHACFLVEMPAPKGSTTRGARILFDPVFSNRCSPSQYVGPARVTAPPMKLSEMPQVDAVVLSHNHYDHTDSTTLKHIYATQGSTVHFFAPLGNRKYFNSIGVADKDMTEMDWWEERDLAVTFKEGETSHLRITATPCQHFSARGIFDKNETLWASWAVTQLPSAAATTSICKVWFGGDTGYKAVPRNATTEVGLPTCPAFREIGEKLGPFDFSMIPIGAYDPRFFMSPIHLSPEDAVEVHKEVKSLKSIGMHWGTWILTSEEMTDPPKRLRSACIANEISEEQFGICDIGETVRATPMKQESKL